MTAGRALAIVGLPVAALGMDIALAAAERGPAFVGFHFVLQPIACIGTALFGLRWATRGEVPRIAAALAVAANFAVVALSLHPTGLKIVAAASDSLLGDDLRLPRSSGTIGFRLVSSPMDPTS
jgi:hypothetical protein